MAHFPIRIGLSGKFGSGKDSFADVVDLPRYAFAAILKQLASYGQYPYNMNAVQSLIQLLLSPESLVQSLSILERVKSLYLKYPFLPGEKNRELLQLLATLLREYDSDVWIKACLNNIPSNTDAIITDLRYKNEAKALLKDGFFLIRIECAPYLRQQRYNLSTPHFNLMSAHQSETDLDSWKEWDMIIDGSLPQNIFQAEARGIISGMRLMRNALGAFYNA